MLYREISEDNNLQPTSFTKLKSRADKVFKEPLGFYVVDIKRPTVRSPIYVYKKRNIDVYNTDDVNEYKEFNKNNFQDKYNLSENQVKIVDVYAADVDIRDGQLQKTDVPTYSQRVIDRRGDYTDPQGELLTDQLTAQGVLTVANASDILRDHPLNGINEPYINAALSSVLDSTKSFTPHVLLQNILEFKRTTNMKTGEFLSDFGEITGPLGLICGTINGNGVRLLPLFFGNTDTEDIIKNATVHFHPSKTHELVDSYIEYRGKVLRISSKSAGQALSGGTGATFKGIYQSISEISKNPEGIKAFNKLMQNGDAVRALSNLQRLAGIATENENNINWLDNIGWLQSLIKGMSTQQNVYGYDITDHDLQILASLWQGRNKTTMHGAKYNIGAALGNIVDKNLADGDTPAFSDGFKNIIKSHNLNKYGETTTAGFENPTDSDTTNASRGWWLRLQKALIFALANIINRDPHFSSLCTWILNHSNFVQIDLNSVSKNNKLIITNIRATWPSTAVDSVELVPVPVGATYKYKLVINGNQDSVTGEYQPNREYPDDNFGWSNDDDIKSAYQLAPRDLARYRGDWSRLVSNLPDYDDPSRTLQNTSTNASLEINGFLKRLAADQIIDANIERAPFNSQKQHDAIKQIVTAIVSNKIDPEKLKFIDRNVEYSLRYLMSLSGSETDFVSENILSEQAEDDDEYTSVKVSQVDRRTAIDHLTIAKNMLLPIYYAIQLDRQLSSGQSPSSDIKTKLKEYLPDIDLIIVNRGKEKPRDTTRNYIPSRIKSQAGAEQSTLKSIKAAVYEFLKKYRLLEKYRTPREQEKYGNQEFQSDISSSQLARFGTSIIWGDYGDQIQEIFSDFNTLLQNAEVKNIISRETLQIRESQGAHQVINEEGISSIDTVAEVLTYLYWCLVARKQIDGGQDPIAALKNAISIAGRVFTGNQDYDNFKKYIVKNYKLLKDEMLSSEIIKVFSLVTNGAKSDLQWRYTVLEKLTQENRKELTKEIFDYIKNINVVDLKKYTIKTNQEYEDLLDVIKQMGIDKLNQQEDREIQIESIAKNKNVSNLITESLKKILHEGDSQNRAAGCLILAGDTGRLCLALRSAEVDSPHTWSIFGGHCKVGESALRGAIRECGEEGGLKPNQIQRVLKLGDNNEGMHYTTFLIVVPHEFTPQLNGEHTEYRWCEPGLYPQNIHPGLGKTLANSYVQKLLARARLRARDK